MAHYTNTPLTEVFEMGFSDIRYWHNEAVRLYNKMNPAPNG